MRVTGGMARREEATSEGLDPELTGLPDCLPRHVRLPRAGRWLAVVLVLAALAARSLCGRAHRRRPGGATSCATGPPPRCRWRRGTLAGEDREAAADPAWCWPATTPCAARPAPRRTRSDAAALDAKLAGDRRATRRRRRSMSSTRTASRSPPATPASRQLRRQRLRLPHTISAEAMAKGAASQYALGTVSGRPGLYLSSRVDERASAARRRGGQGRVRPASRRSWRASGFVVLVDRRTRRRAGHQPSPTGGFGARAAVGRRRGRGPRAAAARRTPASTRCRSRAAPATALARSTVGKPRRSSRSRRTWPARCPAGGSRLLTPADAALSSAATTARLTTLLAAAARGRCWSSCCCGAGAGRSARQEALARDECRAGAPGRHAHGRAQPLQRGTRRRDRRARGRRGQGPPAARRSRPGEPAVDPRPDRRRRRARDQPAAGRDPHLCRECRPLPRRRQGRAGAAAT